MSVLGLPWPQKRRTKKLSFLCRFRGCPGPSIYDFKCLGGPGRPGNPPNRGWAKPHRDIAKMIFLCRLWGSPGPKNDIESKFYCFMSFFGVRPDPNLRVGLALGGRETIEKGGEGRGGGEETNSKAKWWRTEDLARLPSGTQLRSHFGSRVGAKLFGLELAELFVFKHDERLARLVDMAAAVDAGPDYGADGLAASGGGVRWRLGDMAAVDSVDAGLIFEHDDDVAAVVAKLLAA